MKNKTLREVYLHLQRTASMILTRRPQQRTRSQRLLAAALVMLVVHAERSV